jgi:hypothetical protein
MYTIFADEQRDSKKMNVVGDTQGQQGEGGAGGHQRQHRPSLIDLLTGDHSAGKPDSATPSSQAVAHRGKTEFSFVDT